MAGVSVEVLALLAVLSPTRGNPLAPDATSPFQYDWHHLRVAGLVVAAVLCLVGIIVLLSGKCKCWSKASRRRPPSGDVPPRWPWSRQHVLRCPHVSPTPGGGGGEVYFGVNPPQKKTYKKRGN
ncbi:FXYD domain-containing ion transport regulator 3-like [Rissa tridactyla]|uniref:FXYD domain-containing ion transport regulator 3-like n=1 Tax=Rissa tridactyla TaxID=75485 RepID=UPI0023BAA23B|nr:FXYD domain-containing ion transport regulator 3-like [Rissa tridactyla]